MHTPAAADSLSPTPSAHNTWRLAEWLLLLECAAPRPNIDHVASLLQNSVTWPVLLERAEDHAVVPLLAGSVKNLDEALVPPEVRVGLREASRAHTVFTLHLIAQLFQVLERFAETGLEILVTKGPALSVRCYGDSGMRQYSDLDLIIREVDIRRATRILLNIGYQPRVPLTAIDANKIPGE